MTKITESAIEKFAIELLTKQDFEYVCGPDNAPDTETSERGKIKEYNSLKVGAQLNE